MNALLVTIFKVPNFGSVLQTYATQYVIEQLGARCIVLNYDHCQSEWGLLHGIPRQGWKNKIGRFLGLKPHHRKENKLKAFTDKYIHLSKAHRCLQDIKSEENGKYDVYVVGSDQVWNSRFTNCDPVFLLEFVDDGKAHCISVSSSFASNSIDKKYLSEFKTHLAKFSNLSVREQGGITILNDLGYTKAKQILDPTLLLSAAQWNGLRKKNEEKTEKYILLYMLTYAFEPRPLIFDVLDYYQQKLNCKIIALEGYEECLGQTSLEIEDATDSSVADFLRLFANAELVVTSSFHGTAFALNYGRPLISVTPPGADDRQGSLLKQLGLQQCQLQVYGGANLKQLNPFYDVKEEQMKLQALREDSLSWIAQSLK